MNKSNKLLSDLVIYTKYARYVPELGRKETWQEIVKRSEDMHLRRFAGRSRMVGLIKNAFKDVYRMNVLPSMRSLQFAGTSIETNNARMFNCCYLPIRRLDAFKEVMYLLMSGCGVGYSVKSYDTTNLPQIQKDYRGIRAVKIQDTLEGWCDAIDILMHSYLNKDACSEIVFDYSEIRASGTELKTSGGLAPGPEPLKNAIENIKKVFENRIKDTNYWLRPIDVHSIVCHISNAVLSGGVRRSALICLFDEHDYLMKTCKSGEWWETNPEYARANNSAVITEWNLNLSLKALFDLAKDNNSGEPGVFITNDRTYGTNPCAEISLMPYQFCNLVEINGSKVKSMEDFNKFAKSAAIIGTLQANYTNFNEEYLHSEWKENTRKDALIGVGITGITDMEAKKFTFYPIQAADTVKFWNSEVAERLHMNPAARTTTIKPSGSTSCVLGTSSGIHNWYAPYYIRRIRLNKNLPLSKYLMEVIPSLIEEDFTNSNDIVVSIPQKSGSKFKKESCLELFKRTCYYNSTWIRYGHRSGPNHNNTSVTLMYESEEEFEALTKELVEWRQLYHGVSVFPKDNGTYKQAPFEEITKEKYEELYKLIGDIDFTLIKEDHITVNDTDAMLVADSNACSGGTCELI